MMSTGRLLTVAAASFAAHSVPPLDDVLPDDPPLDELPNPPDVFCPGSTSPFLSSSGGAPLDPYSESPDELPQAMRARRLEQAATAERRSFIDIRQPPGGHSAQDPTMPQKSVPME